MKHFVMLVCFCILTGSLFSQMPMEGGIILGQGGGRVSSTKKDTLKLNINYVLIYRQWKQHMESHGDYITPVFGWETTTVVFNSIKEVNDWLNIQGWDKRKGVRIGENELIGLYDLTTAKKIEVKYNVEKKSIEKHVTVEKKEWTDEFFTIEN